MSRIIYNTCIPNVTKLKILRIFRPLMHGPFHLLKFSQSANRGRDAGSTAVKAEGIFGPVQGLELEEVLLELVLSDDRVVVDDLVFVLEDKLDTEVDAQETEGDRRKQNFLLPFLLK